MLVTWGHQSFGRNLCSLYSGDDYLRIYLLTFWRGWVALVGALAVANMVVRWSALSTLHFSLLFFSGSLLVVLPQRIPPQ